MQTHEVQVKKHPRAKSMTLRYQPHKGYFVLTTPRRASRKSIDLFIAEQKDWMQEQCDAYPVAKLLQPGDSLLFLGRLRKLEHTEKPGILTTVEEDTIHLACRIERFPRAIKRFLKQQAEATLSPLVYQKAAQIEKNVTRLAFRDTTSRWGSCARGGRLSFSWRLIMAPPDAIDYVVAHEVAHLKHFNHGDRFWALCSDLSANYAFGKKWLQENAGQLYIAF